MRIDGSSPPSPRSQSSVERTAGPAASPARYPEAPPGLRRRTASGPMPGEPRLDAPQDADAAHRRRAVLPAPQRSEPVQAGANKMRASHPGVVKEFEAALASKPGETKLEQAAADLLALVPLIEAVKEGTATPSSISKRNDAPSGFRYAFDAGGNLRTAPGNPNAAAIINKLAAIRDSHPKVAAKFEAALASKPGETNLERAAADLLALVPLIAAVKEGTATPTAISKRDDAPSSFKNAFDGDGNLKTEPGNTHAAAIINKLAAIRDSHPEVAKRFEEAERRTPSGPKPRPQSRPTQGAARPVEFRVPASRPSARAATAAVPLAPAAAVGAQRSTPQPSVRVMELDQQLDALARAILSVRAGRKSLEAIDRDFRGASRLVTSSGWWRSVPELRQVFNELDSDADRRDFRRLLLALTTLLDQGQQSGAESSGAAEQGAAPALGMHDTQLARSPGISLRAHGDERSTASAAHPAEPPPPAAAGASAEAQVPQEALPLAPARRADSGFSHLSDLSEARRFLDLNAQAVDLPPGVGLSGLGSELWRPRPSSAQAEEEVSSHPRGAMADPAARAVLAAIPPAIVPPARQPPASPSSSALSGFSHLSDLPEAHLWDLNTPAGSPEAAGPQPAAMPQPVAAVPVAQQPPALPAAQAPVQAPAQVQAARRPAPEIIDLDQCASPEQERPRRHDLRNNTWLDDRDIFDYTHVIIQRIAEELGDGGFDRITQRMNFADSQQVSHLLNGDPTLRAQVLSHFNAPVVFLPVNRATENDRENHWSLLVVYQNENEQRAFHFDSLDRPNSAQLGVARQVTRAMGLADPMPRPMAQQADGHSCGDHVLAGIEELTRRFMRNDFSMDLQNLRPNRQEIIDALAVYDQFAEEVHAGRAQPQPHPMQAAPRSRRG